MNNLFCKPRRAFAPQVHEEQDETRIVFARRDRRGFWAPVLGGTASRVLLCLFLLFGIRVVGSFVVPLFLLLYVLLSKSEPKRMRRGYFDHR